MSELESSSVEQTGKPSDSSLDFAVDAARLLEDRHCTDIRLLDLRGISQVCDFILIGSGTSDRQMRSVADEVSMLGKELRDKTTCSTSSQLLSPSPQVER